MDTDETVVQQEYLWPDDRRGPYLLRLTMRATGDRFEVVGLEMWGMAPPVWATEVSGDPDQVDRVKWRDNVRRRWETAVREPVPIRATTIRLPLERIAQDVLAKTRPFLSTILTGKTPKFTGPDGVVHGGRPFSEKAKRAARQLAQAGAPRRGPAPDRGPDHLQEVARGYSRSVEAAPTADDRSAPALFS